MFKTHRVALLGFSEFERSTLGSYFRLASRRNPSYELVSTGDDSDFILADADHAPSVQLVLATDRLAETVFVGSQAPAGALAWMMRPIDPLHVMRELDALVLLAAGDGPASAGATLAGHRTVVQAPRRPRAPSVADPTASPGEAAAPVAARAPERPVMAGAAQAPAAPARPEAPAVPPPPTALLVDDSPLALRFLASRLEPWGLAVESVGSSSQAVERLAQRNYDFVFLDVELGADSELDGLALCQHIKRHHALAGSLLVMVSAHHSELDRVRGTLAGADAYLGKPLRAAELERLLERQGLKRKTVPAAPAGPATPGLAATGAPTRSPAPGGAGAGSQAAGRSTT